MKIKDICLANVIDGVQITLKKDYRQQVYNYENGITHCYLRNLDNGLCYDVRGESSCDEEIITYTEVNYYSGNVEEYNFENIEDFKMFLKWIEFEIVKDYYLAG